MTSIITTCKNCGNQFKGNYCNVCGEKVHHAHHKKISHLFEEAVHFITHFDGSFITTIRTVFTRPGQLSLDYCNGIRKKYFKPLSFFLVCVVLYLLFPRFEGLNMKMDTYTHPRYNFTWMTLPLVKQKEKSSHVSYKELAKKYDEKSPKISKIFLLVLIPLMAALLYLLFFRQRPYYFDHFILATEYGSVWIAIKFLLLPAIMVTGSYFNPSFVNFFDDSNMVLFVSVNILFLGILILSFRRFYGQKWLWTILKAIIFLAIFEIFIMQIYHSLLFLITMLFI